MVAGVLRHEVGSAPSELAAVRGVQQLRDSGSGAQSGRAPRCPTAVAKALGVPIDVAISPERAPPKGLSEALSRSCGDLAELNIKPRFTGPWRSSRGWSHQGRIHRGRPLFNCTHRGHPAQFCGPTRTQFVKWCEARQACACPTPAVSVASAPRLRPDLEDDKSGVVVDHARAERTFTRKAAGCNPLLGGPMLRGGYIQFASLSPGTLE